MAAKHSTTRELGPLGPACSHPFGWGAFVACLARLHRAIRAYTLPTHATFAQPLVFHGDPMHAHRALSAVALFFTAAASLALAQGPPRDGPPGIEVQPAAWDLGSVAPGQYQQVFEIANKGGAPLVIDQVRVSHPLRMSAVVSPLGTETGRRFQLTVLVVLDGTEPAFDGYAIVHSNDKERPHVKIPVSAKMQASTGALVFFFSEEGAGVKRLRERIALLKVQAEVLDAGDLANLDRLRKLEAEHGVAQTAAYELFMGRECLIVSDPEEVLKAIERVASGGGLQGRRIHPHQHTAETPAGKASISTLVPPPVSVDLYIDPGCAACVEAGRRAADMLKNRYAGRVAISARDITHPDSVRLFRDRLAEKECPPGTHSVALVAGATWVTGEIPAIMEALPPIVDKELASLSAMTAGGPPKGGTDKAAPAPKPASQATESGAILWVVVALTALTLVRVSLLRNRGQEGAPSK